MTEKFEIEADHRLEVPCHRINTLDLLKPGSPTLVEDCTLIADVIVKDHKSETLCFSDEARHCMDARNLLGQFSNGAV